MYQTATTGQSTGVTNMGNTNPPTSGADWGFKYAGSVFTNVALSEGDVMNIDVSVKMVGAGNGTSTTCLTIAD